ncbi:MAG TPA: 3-dehydroquinate synthase [Limnochordales bacterium]
MSGNLYLIGFMGSGKSSVGRRLADVMGRTFVDMDIEIEAREGRPIAAIFEQDGEAYFRQIEQAVLAELSARDDLVVATGGGVVESPANRARMAESGEVVWLYQDLARAVERAVAQGSPRPLLGTSADGALDRAKALWKRRQWWYAEAPVWVDAREGTPDQVASRVLDARRWRAMGPVAGWVLAGGRACPVLVGRGLVARLDAIVTLLAERDGLGGGALVVADRAVRELGERAAQALGRAGWRTALAEVGPGESAKRLEQLATLYGEAVRAGVDRGGLVVAVGGGATLDVAGFMAATYMRGIAWVGVPTTLLAQVDAGIGGKTAVNIPEAKNLVGAFHQPLAVVADLDALATLPPRELASGMAEVIKHGLVGDPRLWERLSQDEATPDAAGRPGPEEMASIVGQAVAVKALVVSEDPTERGRRVVLNFGHTTGHALEAAGGFERWSHGEAVAIGMVTAAMLSARLGLLRDASLVERLRATLRRHGLPVDAGPRPPEASRLWELMGADKKRQAGRRRWVLLEAPGEPVVVSDEVELSLFESVWREQHRGGEASST